MEALHLDRQALARIVAAALSEDLGDAGDLTTDAVVGEDRRARGLVRARAGTVVAGLPVAAEVFRQVDATVSCAPGCAEGGVAEPGSVLATVTGNARAILRGERTALNFLTRMCGIATAARQAVDEVAGTGARILDTRKTAPGLRLVDKYAVAAGGAVNHRLGLYDAVMIKDTHLAVADSLEAAVARALERGVPSGRITAEVRSLDDLEAAIRAGAGRVLLDNMDLETIREAVRRAGGRIVLEASGGLRPGKLRAVAETGVDFLSLGWLTHSAPAADLAMELEALP